MEPVLQGLRDQGNVCVILLNKLRIYLVSGGELKQQVVDHRAVIRPPQQPGRFLQLAADKAAQRLQAHFRLVRGIPVQPFEYTQLPYRLYRLLAVAKLLRHQVVVRRHKLLR
jgi:hypothetical protein